MSLNMVGVYLGQMLLTETMHFFQYCLCIFTWWYFQLMKLA